MAILIGLLICLALIFSAWAFAAAASRLDRAEEELMQKLKEEIS